MIIFVKICVKKNNTATMSLLDHKLGTNPLI